MNKDNEKEFTPLEYNTAETNLYSDLCLIEYDLDLGLDAIERALEHISSQDETDRDRNLLIHLMTSALSYYYRCFGSGARKHLHSSEIFDDKEYEAAHEYLINYRSKYVIHSVNNFEQGKCGIILSDRDPNKATVLGLVNTIRKLQYPKDLDYQLMWLKRLIFKCHIFINDKLESLEEKIFSSAQKNIKEICNGPELVCTAPDLAKVKKPRPNKKSI